MSLFLHRIQLQIADGGCPCPEGTARCGAGKILCLKPSEGPLFTHKFVVHLFSGREQT